MAWQTVFYTIGSPLGALLAGGVAFIVWRDTHTDRSHVARQTQIDHSIEPIKSKLAILEHTNAHSPAIIEAAITRALQPVFTHMASLDTRTEMMLDQQKALALDVARLLHHPIPERAELDALLDAVMDDTLTEEEEIKLRKFLVLIKGWEPGQDIGFPVYDGEQVLAAILLRSLGGVLVPRHSRGVRTNGQRSESHSG
jgi:hypothetical protein